MTSSLLEAIARPGAEGGVLLVSPEVGRWREGPPAGRILRPGDPLGRIERLGSMISIVVPRGAAGMVTERFGADLARPSVAYGSPLVVLDPASGAVAGDVAVASEEAEDGGLILRAPMGGRFYLRSAPGKPPFISVGDVIEEGRTVALLEVMKTFNRVPYGGAGLPSPARVKAILRTDDDDVSAGDALLEVEEA
ncbi:MAG: biotin/lipoyl-containing protein [Myxococcota bacterium]